MEWSIQQLFMSNFSVARLQKSERVGQTSYLNLKEAFLDSYMT